MGGVKHGVVIVLVPFLELGSDQVEKSIVSDHNIESYHIDEHRGIDAKALRDRYDAMDNNKMAYTTIMLYISPSSLAINKHTGKPSPWIRFIQKIVDCGHLSLFCIDKAHYVHQNGRHFRPDFLITVDKIKIMIDSSIIFIPAIAMSATICSTDRKNCG